MKIGEIAQQLEVSTSIIRHYEGKGLLPPACRDWLGYRNYNQADLERIKLVVGARDLGISLADIREILAIYDKGQIPSPRILELLRQKASRAEQRRHRLASVKRELHRLRDLALRLNQFHTERLDAGQDEKLEQVHP